MGIGSHGGRPCGLREVEFGRERFQKVVRAQDRFAIGWKAVHRNAADWGWNVVDRDGAAGNRCDFRQGQNLFERRVCAFPCGQRRGAIFARSQIRRRLRLGVNRRAT